MSIDDPSAPPGPPRCGSAAAQGDQNRAPARACWITAPGQAEIREAPLSAPGPGQALVRALHGAVSRGTESLVFRGLVPPAEHARMRAPFQEGEFPGPVKYGYCSVGVVEDGPSDWRGREVFCLHPHQTRYVVPVAALHPLPPGLPASRAVLAPNLETAINGLWDAPPRMGDRVAVVGAGVVGLMAAWLAARVPGCAVQVVDLLPEREAMARALGADFALPGQAMRDADLVVHASGTGQGLATALALAGFEATVLELSWFGANPVSVPLGEAFHSRRLTLRSSQVGQVATAQRARWSHDRRMALALALLADHPVLDALTDACVPFEGLPKALAGLSERPGGPPCLRVRYD